MSVKVPLVAPDLGWLLHQTCFKGPLKQGLSWSGIVRHTDVKIIFMKRDICYAHRSLETGSKVHQAEPHTEALGSVRRQKGKCGKSLYCGFYGRE